MIQIVPFEVDTGYFKWTGHVHNTVKLNDYTLNKGSDFILVSHFTFFSSHV